ncbi:MAG: pteridine reductase [Gammaproteobacteria bacterium]|nr:pteridine reductase [Gammaproteobacteria bacterium]MBT7308563.1 pteridine reductase [Gammaproteobacteria bacterium]
MDGKVALITGAAQRIGAATAQLLHHSGMKLVIHYRNSDLAARRLQQLLESNRSHSVTLLQGDLHQTQTLKGLVEEAAAVWGRLDALINNASTFYPTPFGTITENQWDELLGINLKAPLFLAQAAAPYLTQQQGNIINMIDIHADRPLKEHPVYSTSKAGLAMLTKSLARELGPEIRVNGVAPGAILWPENEINATTKAEIIARTALKRSGAPSDIAHTIRFLIRDAHYITGQILNVDGGRTLSN